MAGGSVLCEEIEMARRDIEFNAEGVILRGWFYAAEASPAPAVVMAHGFSAVKEMYLDSFPEGFNGAGLHVPGFDNRNFGATAGQPAPAVDPRGHVPAHGHAHP